MEHKIKKLLAFTLSETLLVMGIIGVIAALTVPNLNQSTGDRQTVAKVKKLHSQFAEAYDRVEVTYGPINKWASLNATTFGDRLTEFMKVSKNCKVDSNNTSCYSGSSGWYRFVLADGTAAAVSAADLSAANMGWSANINVDVNGPTAGKHTSGKDVFYFQLSTVGDGPTNSWMVTPQNYQASFATLLNSAKTDHCYYDAATWILNYDNMDYLKIKTDGTCPNGTTPTESNPRCK